MIRKKLKGSRKNQTQRAETVEKNTHTKEECLDARPKEVNATIEESSTTLPNTAWANLDKKTPLGADWLIENPARCSDLRKLSDYSEKDKDVFTLSPYSTGINCNKHPMFKVRVNETWLDLLVDSGSSIHLLDCKSLNKLKPRPTLEPTNAKIYPYK